MAATVYDVFRETTQRYADHPMLYVPVEYSSDGSPFEISYSNMFEAVECQRAIYSEAGVATGHRVGLMLENRPDFFVQWLSLNALGACVVPLNAEMTAAEMAYVLDHSSVSAVVCLDTLRATASDAVEAAGGNIAIETVGQDSMVKPGAFTKLDSAGESDRETPCAIMYTSGSTGKPKGCVLSNEYFIAMGEWYRDLGGYCHLESGSERLLTPLPLFHMNAMACSAVAMMLTGGCLIQLDRFHPDTWWKVVSESRATVIHYLGIIPAICLNMEEAPEEKAHCVKFGLGSGINPDYHASFEERFGFPMIEGWAMTETGAGGAIMANRDPRHPGTSCFGWPGPEVEIKLVAEDETEVNRGEPGELLVRRRGDDPGRYFFSGYLGDEETTRDAWRDGFFHSGDVVYAGEDGQLHFVDRRKNIIRRSGENISAVEVEGVLGKHPAVTEVAVTPVPDELRGDEIMALVILAEGFEPSEEIAREISLHCREQMAYFKVPGYVKFCAEIPVTASNKFQRGAIKETGRGVFSRGDYHDVRDQKARNPKQATITSTTSRTDPSD